MTLRYVKRGDVILPDDHNAVRQAFIDLCDTVKAKSPGAPDVQAKCDEIKAKASAIRTVTKDDYVLASDHNIKREVLRIDIPALWELVSAYQAEFVDKRLELIDKALLIPERKYGDFVFAEDHNSVISTLELAQSQAEQVNIPPPPIGVIWHCDSGVDRIYELSVDDFSVIRYASSPATFPRGLGGGTDTIWHCDDYANAFYELSVVDFSVIRSTASGVCPRGIGGKADVIWHTEEEPDRVHELSTIDFSSLRSATAPGPNPQGVGGDTDTIWHCEVFPDRFHELSTADLSSIRYVDRPDAPSGAGGDVDTVWHCDIILCRIYELSQIDFSELRSAPSPATSPQDIGGE